MLTLKNITKDYVTGDTVVNALKGISVEFRNNEFVSILGASGCGKTTLLNIVGGLDRYTSGDLIINGVSTKQYEDGDWDAYRNHSIGFVFQTYNLIMHQTVLGNVELALTLSGVSPKERREMAIEALNRVGLADQINKKPNQLSGGQMQRVAIARAIVNNPDIILADEPTGALDTATSVQIMDILKEIAKDKLVIMVTHNPDLAEAYSTRIVRLSDGNLISDTNPVFEDERLMLAREDEIKIANVSDCDTRFASDGDNKKPRKTCKNKQKRPSMSFKTALTLSLKNLLTKKARTMLVSFAGSIGIIGIALILSLSNGFQAYINRVQEDTLSNYPLTIEKETVDMSSMVSAVLGVVEDDEKEKEPNRIYANNMMNKMLATMLQQRVTNNLAEFNRQLTSAEELKECITAIKYTYRFTPQIYFMADQALNATHKTVQVNPSKLMNNMFSGMGVGMNAWSEMLDNQALLESQYDLLGDSRWPENYNEVVVVVDKNEEINDFILYSLGILDQAELEEMMDKINKGEEVVIPERSFTYDQILGLKYKLLLQTDRYNYNAINGIATEKTAEELQTAIENSMDIRVVGIIKPKVSAAATSITGTIGYTKALTEEISKLINDTDIVKAQTRNPDINVFTGKEFVVSSSTEYTLDDVKRFVQESGFGNMVDIDQYIEQLKGQGYTQEQAENYIIEEFKSYMVESDNGDSYEGNIRKLGHIELDKPETISIYAVDFESKDKITAWIDEYNKTARKDNPSDVISYTDYIGLMMSSISTIINAISYILIGFVAISLVVSSIMIAVITYISVLERTKEIGILRSIGASKKDISRVFNAETFIVGLVAGVMGVLVAMLIDVPINIILAILASLYNIAAVPWWGALGLIIISIILTLIAGIIPSRMAAKKDPVIALRSE